MQYCIITDCPIKCVWNFEGHKYLTHALKGTTCKRKDLTHWGRVTYICVGKLTIIDSDNGLSPGRHQAIIWTNAEILLIGSLGTNFHEILIGIQTFSFKKMHFKMSSAKWRPFCLGLNVSRAHERLESLPITRRIIQVRIAENRDYFPQRNRGV